MANPSLLEIILFNWWRKDKGDNIIHWKILVAITFVLLLALLRTDGENVAGIQFHFFFVFYVSYFFVHKKMELDSRYVLVVTCFIRSSELAPRNFNVS